jgi:glycosyltransferase involved in cell wall biosynthesis
MLSFIVPAYNEAYELPGTLDAIRAAADAAGEPYEIIVADDESDDATAEIARAAGARVVRVHLRQIAAVRNAGAAAATGDTFFFVDADTHITPVHVTAGREALARGCSGGSARIVLDARVPLWARIFLRVFAALYFGSNLGAGAFMFMRREDFEAVGGFDEQYFAGEEMYLSKALKTRGRFTILRKPVTTSARKVRMHSGWHVLRQWFSLLFRGEEGLRRRDGLELWYDGKREQASYEKTGGGTG